MRKKKKIVIAACIVLVAIVSIAIYFGYRMFMVFPEKAEWYIASGKTSIIGGGGLFYMRNHIIYYLDPQTNKSSVICKKPGCKHMDTSCDAYIDGPGSHLLLCYNNKLYVDQWGQDINEDEDGNVNLNGSNDLIEMNTDGTERKIVFRWGSGATNSLLAKGDKLYFTGSRLIDEENPKFDHPADAYNNYVYSYNLRWGTVKEMACFPPEETQLMSSINVFNTEPSTMLYYTIKDKGCDFKIFKVEENELEELYSLNGTILPEYYTFDEKTYIWNIYGDRFISTADQNFNEKEKLIGITEEGNISMLGDGYVQLICSDYKKALYHLQTGELYIANTSFVDSGKYISDLVNVDSANDILYIDNHDYTGMQPGTVFTESKSDYGCTSLSSFLRENYYRYEDLSNEQKEKLSWIVFY